MSICKDGHHGKASTSRQIYNHVKKTETPMHDVRELMLNVLSQYQKADKIGFSLGVLDKNGSFTDSVSWCSIIGKMDHHKQNLDETSKEQLVKLVGYLDELTNTFDEQVILPIQKYRDRWMMKVILWDLLAFGLLAVAVVGGLYWSGAEFDKAYYLDLIQQRPLFLSLSAIIGVAAFGSFHLFIRRIVKNNMIEAIEEKLPTGMSLIKALTRNTRIRHSIFRPIPVGWSFSQRQRLKAISNMMLLLREQLADVLDNYSDIEDSKAV